MLNKFLTSNESKYRLARTIVQGAIGAVVANLDVITKAFSISNELKPLVVAVIMAVLSPIMAEIGKHTTNNDTMDEQY